MSKPPAIKGGLLLSPRPIYSRVSLLPLSWASSPSRPGPAEGGSPRRAPGDPHPDVEVEAAEAAGSSVEVEAELLQAEPFLQEMAQVVLQQVPARSLLQRARPREEPPRHFGRAGQAGLRGTSPGLCDHASPRLQSRLLFQCRPSPTAGWKHI